MDDALLRQGICCVVVFLYRNMYSPFMEVDRVQVQEFRASIAKYLEEALGGRRLLIERHGGPIAALVPLADFYRLTRKEKPMGHRIALNNVSGGEGKTFLTFHLAFALADLGFRVAVLDCDPQASLTKRFGLHDEEGAYQSGADTILPVFEADDDPTLPPPVNVQGIDLWPANRQLIDADTRIMTNMGRLSNLSEALDKIENLYDFILLDTRPNVSPLLSASTAAARRFLVPIGAHKGLENLDELLRLVKLARKEDRSAHIAFFIPNKVTSTRMGKHVLQNISSYTEIAPIAPPIRQATVGPEAELFRTGVTRHAPKSPLASDIRVLADAIIKMTQPVPVEEEV